jgi:glucose-1-phosphate adenylyltransferase
MNINATGIIFSNIHDEELHEITTCQTMGSLPFAGRYRLIDFALSNMHNSDIADIAVITKSNYQMLMEHLGSGKEWDLARKRGGLHIFPPFGLKNAGFYKNKIEALFGILSHINKTKSEYLMISDCDVICNMDWKKPFDYHIKKEADITIVYYRVNPNKDLAENESVYIVSPEGYATNILLNQKVQKECCIGTNMWIIAKSFFVRLIEDAAARNLENFERDILQKKVGEYKIAAWEFDGYIRKINSVKDFFYANMDILNPQIRNDLFGRYGSVRTKVHDDIPTRYGNSIHVSNTLVADGCLIEGNVENSILFRGVKIGKGSRIRNSIIMQNSIIGENVNLNYVLADQNVTFQDNRVLMGCDIHPVYLGKENRI